MRTRFAIALALFLAPMYLAAAADLQVYAIDVEGGKSTLFVSPSGESMLVDTGYDGYNNRDADRIVAAAHAAGIHRIDYLVITHYHKDHAGGVRQLAARIPIQSLIQPWSKVRRLDFDCAIRVKPQGSCCRCETTVGRHECSPPASPTFRFTPPHTRSCPGQAL